MALSNWDTAEKEEGSLYVVLFISRNKDNRNVENFTERKQSFVYHSVNPMTDERLKEKFKDFLSGGVPGETCRFAQRRRMLQKKDGCSTLILMMKTN